MRKPSQFTNMETIGLCIGLSIGRLCHSDNSDNEWDNLKPLKSLPEKPTVTLEQYVAPSCSLTPKKTPTTWFSIVNLMVGERGDWWLVVTILCLHRSKFILE
jgi:hypothetical protein